MDRTLCNKDHDHHNLQCVNRTCSKCGVHLLKENLLPLQNAQVTWLKWENDPNLKKKVLVTKTGSAEQLIDELTEELKPFAQHLFVAHWQYEQFTAVSRNPPADTVVLCMDFAENFACQLQNEIQSAHWSHNQVTLHPVIAYYNENGNVIREAIDIISDDLNHDSHAVHEFLIKVNDHLRITRELHPDKMVIFSDGCAAQYKSRTPFADVSFAEEDLMCTMERNYFGSRHGKGPCDGEGGVVKAALTRAVKNEHLIPASAQAVFTFCKAELSKESDTFRRTFILIPKESIQRYRVDRDVKTVKGTRQIHSLRSTGNAYSLQRRRLSCYCTACTSYSDGCVNKQWIQPWERLQLSSNINQVTTGTQPAANPSSVKDNLPTMSVCASTTQSATGTSGDENNLPTMMSGCASTIQPATGASGVEDNLPTMMSVCPSTTQAATGASGDEDNLPTMMSVCPSTTQAATGTSGVENYPTCTQEYTSGDSASAVEDNLPTMMSVCPSTIQAAPGASGVEDNLPTMMSVCPSSTQPATGASGVEDNLPTMMSVCPSTIQAAPGASGDEDNLPTMMSGCPSSTQPATGASGDEDNLPTMMSGCPSSTQPATGASGDENYPSFTQEYTRSGDSASAVEDNLPTMMSVCPSTKQAAPGASGVEDNLPTMMSGCPSTTQAATGTSGVENYPTCTQEYTRSGDSASAVEDNLPTMMLVCPSSTQPATGASGDEDNLPTMMSGCPSSTQPATGASGDEDNLPTMMSVCPSTIQAAPGASGDEDNLPTMMSGCPSSTQPATGASGDENYPSCTQEYTRSGDSESGVEPIGVCEFVVTRVESLKGPAQMFIGQIVQHDKELYQVKFMKRVNDGKYIWPPKEDYSWVPRSDIAPVNLQIITSREHFVFNKNDIHNAWRHMQGK
ncbi:uncharacterized protein [Ptychodera flava]|uniref:uncharacterized protein isoform X2 n=1 Tax=Ptychodera flava TaxID=63121 RepID=UPI003969CE9F